jgi:hypothetical protein
VRDTARRWRLWRKVFFIFGILFTGVILMLALTLSHWWKICGGINTTADGHSIPDATVYCSRHREFFLVHLRSTNEFYLIAPGAHRIGIPNSSSFIFFPGVAYSKTLPPLSAPMEKAELDGNLIIESGRIEFTSINRSRIRLSSPSL